MMRQHEKRILDTILNNSTYDNRIRPSPSFNVTSSASFVTVNLLIRSVSRIDDFLMEYSVQLLLRMEWYDDRLHYRINSRVNKGDLPDYLTITDTSKVWTPDIFFTNEKEARLHKTVKPNEYLRIFPNGQLLYSSRISLVLECPMNLQFFPMDTQICSIGMASYGHSLGK